MATPLYPIDSLPSILQSTLVDFPGVVGGGGGGTTIKPPDWEGESGESEPLGTEFARVAPLSSADDSKIATPPSTINTKAVPNQKTPLFSECLLLNSVNAKSN